jgi:hypothetical protein
MHTDLSWMSEDIRRLARAYAFAAERHGDQRRKGDSALPYLHHLTEVAALVAGAADDGDADLVIAAVLHDVVEDTGTTGEELDSLFGADVARLVAECTDDPGLDKQERRRMQVVSAAGKSRRARLIKLGDKTSNLRALVTRPPESWPADRRLSYVEWAKSVAAGLRGVDDELEEAFDSAAAAAARHFAGAGGNGAPAGRFPEQISRQKQTDPSMTARPPKPPDRTARSSRPVGTVKPEEHKEKLREGGIDPRPGDPLERNPLRESYATESGEAPEEEGTPETVTEGDKPER